MMNSASRGGTEVVRRVTGHAYGTRARNLNLKANSGKPAARTASPASASTSGRPTLHEIAERIARRAHHQQIGLVGHRRGVAEIRTEQDRQHERLGGQTRAGSPSSRRWACRWPPTHCWKRNSSAAPTSVMMEATCRAGGQPATPTTAPEASQSAAPEPTRLRPSAMLEATSNTTSRLSARPMPSNSHAAGHQHRHDAEHGGHVDRQYLERSQHHHGGHDAQRPRRQRRARQDLLGIQRHQIPLPADGLDARLRALHQQQISGLQRDLRESPPRIAADRYHCDAGRSPPRRTVRQIALRRACCRRAETSAR